MKCFYHNDLDGRCAGAIVARYVNSYNSNYFYEVDYNTGIPIDTVNNGEIVFIVDLSFTEKTVEQLYSLLDKDCDVRWVDHHKSSLDLLRNVEYYHLNNVKGIRSDEYSGAALTWMYLYDKPYYEIPYVVKLVSDYDCWKYQFDPDTTHFKLGIELTDYDALSSVWRELFDDNKITISVQYGPGERDSTYTLDKIISDGNVVKKYVDNELAIYRKSYAYETEIDGHKAVAVNRRSNSWIFGELYDIYPICIPYVHNGEKWEFSLFSNANKFPDIDCSKIAKKYGGGGHAHAAGACVVDLPFKKIGEVKYAK